MRTILLLSVVFFATAVVGAPVANEDGRCKVIIHPDGTHDLICSPAPLPFP